MQWETLLTHEVGDAESERPFRKLFHPLFYEPLFCQLHESSMGGL